MGVGTSFELACLPCWSICPLNCSTFRVPAQAFVISSSPFLRRRFSLIVANLTPQSAWGVLVVNSSRVLQKRRPHGVIFQRRCAPGSCSPILAISSGGRRRLRSASSSRRPLHFCLKPLTSSALTSSMRPHLYTAWRGHLKFVLPGQIWRPNQVWRSSRITPGLYGFVWFYMVFIWFYMVLNDIWFLDGFVWFLYGFWMVLDGLQSLQSFCIVYLVFAWFLHVFFFRSFYMVFTRFLKCFTVFTEFLHSFTWFLRSFYMGFTWFLHSFT